MKYICCVLLVCLVGCSSQRAPDGVQVPSVVDASVPGAPIATLDINGESVSRITDAASITGDYFSHAGGRLRIGEKGVVQITNLLGERAASGYVKAGPGGALLYMNGDQGVALSRHLMGLSVGGERLFRTDGLWMFDQPADARLIGRFVSKSGAEIVSTDGRVLNVLPAGRAQAWRRYMHDGQYRNTTNGGTAISMSWVHGSASPPVWVELIENGLVIGGDQFLRQPDHKVSMPYAGSFKDANGNYLEINEAGSASFKLQFPGKSSAVEATGYGYAINDREISVFSDQVGRAFTFAIKRLAMGHVIVHMPSVSGSSPIVLLTNTANPDSIEKDLLGVYINPEAYGASVNEDGQLILKPKLAITNDLSDLETDGALSKTLVGIEIRQNGEAHFHYDQGPILKTWVEKRGADKLAFYFSDYNDQPLYNVGGDDAIELALSWPEDGFRRSKVPTIEYGNIDFRHYPSAHEGILADAFEALERQKDLEFAEKMEQDPEVMLSRYDSQAERERRMRLREDGRKDGNPTPSLGEFYVSGHQARVMEMEKLAHDLSALPVPRNAYELRANMQKEKEIRARAAELEKEDREEAARAP